MDGVVTALKYFDAGARAGHLVGLMQSNPDGPGLSTLEEALRESLVELGVIAQGEHWSIRQCVERVESCSGVFESNCFWLGAHLLRLQLHLKITALAIDEPRILDYLRASVEVITVTVRQLRLAAARVGATEEVDAFVKRMDHALADVSEWRRASTQLFDDSEVAVARVRSLLERIAMTNDVHIDINDSTVGAVTVGQIGSTEAHVKTDGGPSLSDLQSSISAAGGERPSGGVAFVRPRARQLVHDGMAMGWRKIGTWIAVLVLGLALVGLGLFFGRIGLDQAGKVAEIIGAFTGLLGLALSIYALLPQRSSSSLAREAPLDAGGHMVSDSLIAGDNNQFGNVGGDVTIRRGDGS